MVRKKRIRDIVFITHRYIGLAVGIVLAIVGMTGSILVFRSELVTAQTIQNLPSVVPNGDRLAIEMLYDRASTYLKTKAPDNFIEGFSPSDFHLFLPNEPVYVRHLDTAKKLDGFFLNPYTGDIIGDDSNIKLALDAWEWLLQLHINLLAGDAGLYFVGIVGLLATILVVTGIVLWPGWGKFINGFKIKWDGHAKRRNYDLHKVIGIVTSIFLAMTTFTGFCWNFDPWITSTIHAVTFSDPNTKDSSIISKPVAGIENVDLLRQHITKITPVIKAQYPNWELANVYIDPKPEGVISAIGYLLPNKYEAFIFAFDKYSGTLIRKLGTATLGDRITGSFAAIHFGTFAGLPSRILYIFVGISPTILLITGFIMWKLRRPNHPGRNYTT
jgi:uncharacterized iron-regulated membrane protein